MVKFLNIWRSGEESSLTLQCKEGKMVLNFQVSLSSPDQSRYCHGCPHHEQPQKKSERRKQKDNARAAAYRVAKATPAVPAGPPAPQANLLNVSTSPARRVTSPATLSHSTCPVPTFQAVTSQKLLQHQGRRKVWEPSDLNTTLAGERETLPLSPIVQ